MTIRILACFCCFASALCASCDDDNVTPETFQHDFYAFGELQGKGVYWENGETKTIEGNPRPDDVFDGAAAGSDVYTIGSVDDGSSYMIAAYWNNGKIVKLSNGTKHEEASAIVIVGSDIYIAGHEWQGDRTVAKYWKNGIGVVLPAPEGFSKAVGIAVSGSDVHVIGWAHNRFTAPDSTFAMYWKNGSRIKTEATSAHESPRDIAISGSDVYFAGSITDETSMPRAKLWKNGIPTPLTDSGVESNASQLEIIGNDIYAAGQNNKRAVYWKNGVITSLETGATLGSDVTGMISVGNGVIISGINFEAAFAYQGSFVWKDGGMERPFTGDDGSYYITGIAPSNE